MRPVAPALFLLALLGPAAASAPVPAPATGTQDAARAVAAPELDAELLTFHPGRLHGDPAALRRDLVAALEAAPEHPLAEDAARALLDAGLEGVDGDEPRRLRTLLARVRDAEVSRLLRLVLQQHARRTRFGPDPVRPGLELDAEFLDRWQVLGPVGPLADGFPATLPAPEDSPEPRSVDEAPARLDLPQRAPGGGELPWRDVELARNRFSFSPGAQVWPAAGLTYARCQLETVAGTERVLELSCDGAVRAWWNGALLVDEPATSPAGAPARHRYHTRCQGHDMLLMRVPTARGDRLSARLLGPDGTLLPDGEGRAVPYEPGSWSAATRDPEPLPGAEARPPAPGPFGPALEVARALQRGRPDEALDVEAPDDARGLDAWRLARLRALEAASHLPPEVVRRATLEQLDALDAGGGGYAAARARRIELHLREDRPAEALDLAEAWCAERPDAAAPHFVRALCWNALDPRGVLTDLALRELRVTHPDHVGTLEVLAGLAERAGDPGRALDLSLEALALDGSGGEAFERALGHLRGTDDPRRARLVAAVRAWDEVFPDTEEAFGMLEALLRGSGPEGDAEVLARWEAWAAEHAHLPGALWSLASEQAAQGHLSEARATWAALRDLDPASRPVRLALARLGGEDPAERFFATFAPDREEALERAADVTDASVVEALDSGLAYLFPDGSLQARYQTLSVPRDRKGTEDLHESPVAANTRVARVLAGDGRVLEPVEVQGNWVLPALEPGDVVEYVWDRHDDGLPGVAPDVGVWRFASFERAFPTSRYVLFVPDGLPGELRLENFDGRHEELPWEGGTVHVMTASSDRQVEEPLRPSDLEVLPWASYGEDRGRRGELSAWRAQLEQLAWIPADLEADVAAYAAAVEAPDDLSRARALYEALDARTRDHQGQPMAGHVWLLRRGNPLFLLAALYERAGVPHEWAVLERATAPELDPEPVTPFENTRPLAQMALRLGVVDEDGAPVWVLPPPGPGFPFGAIPDELAGARAHVLEGGPRGTSTRVEELPRTQLERSWSSDLSITYRLEPDGSAAVVGRFVDSSPGGEVGRRQLGEATAQQLEQVARNVAGQSVPGLDLTSAAFDLDTDEGRGLVLDFEGRLPGFVQVRGDGGEASLRMASLNLSTGFGPAQRRWPLALRNALRRRVTVTVEGGEAWRVVAGPAELEETAPGFRLDLETELDGDGARFRAVRRLELRGLRLEPDEMTGFLNRMGEAEAEFQRPLRLERRDG